MSLRPFLAHLERHPDAARLSEPGTQAFVSQSLRPYLIAAIADRDARRPTVVVAGDDRAARDLAADLRAWLRPRAVRFYPSRGVAYESHLTPPAHLVGLRVAALDALLDRSPGTEAPVVVVSAVALSEKVPDPALRPHGFTLAGRRAARPRRVRATTSSPPATSARTRSRTAASSRSAAGCSTSTRRPRSGRSASTCSTTRSSRCAGSRRSRSARSAPPRWSRSRPRPSSPPSTASSRRSRRSRAPDERPDIAELLPVDDFRDLLDLIPDESELVLSAEEDVEPALRDHWDDVCAAFHDSDAHHLYVKPDGILAALEARRPLRLSSISGSQPLEFRAQAAEFAARSLREAEPELEKLSRSGYTTLVTWPNRGGGERAAYNLARIKARWDGTGEGLVFQEANLRDGFVAPGLALAAIPEHRLIHRRKASTRPTRRGRGLLRSFTDLRTGDHVVHEDHGVARFAGFDTKTVERHHARLPEPRVPGRRQGLHAGRPAGEDLALRRRRRQRARRSPSSAARAGTRSRRVPARPPRSSPASCSTSTPSASAGAATRSSPTRTGCASSRRRSPTARRPTSATRSRPSRPTWSPSARWTG